MFSKYNTRSQSLFSIVVFEQKIIPQKDAQKISLAMFVTELWFPNLHQALGMKREFGEIPKLSPQL